MRRCRRSRLLAAGLALVAWSAFSQTVTFDLKNGDRITGQILSETNNRVVLSNVLAREIIIPLAEVTKRTALLPATNNVVAKAAVTNAPTKTNAVVVAKAVAATNMLFTSPLLKNWHGDIQAGVDLTFSERDRQIFYTRAKITYAKDKLKNVFDYNFTYGQSQSPDTDTPARNDTKTVVDANRMDGSMKTDYDVTKKWFVYHLGGGGYDEIRKIDLRYETGPGIGYHLIQWTNFFLNTEAGATYQVECRSDDTELSTFFGRAAQNATWKITPRLTWDEKFEYMPRIEEFDEFRIRFETNLRYALLQNIFFNLSLIDIYDSLAASGVTQNDVQVRSSIGVKF